MTTKLTLSVEKNVIQKAKQYARKHKRSLSEIVSCYLRSLTDERDVSEEIDEEVMALADEIPAERLSALDDAKYRFLKDKYLHE